MKKFSLMLLVMLVPAFFAVSGVAQQKGQVGIGQRYDPQVKYRGSYQSDVLYVKNSGSKIIQAIPHLDRLEFVTCYDALDNLKRDGKWKGHLNPDGSCGSYDEPAQYTMGNRINYDEPSVDE